jgi:hypothetical protein
VHDYSWKRCDCKGSDQCDHMSHGTPFCWPYFPGSKLVVFYVEFDPFTPSEPYILYCFSSSDLTHHLNLDRGLAHRLLATPAVAAPWGGCRLPILRLFGYAVVPQNWRVIPVVALRLCEETLCLLDFWPVVDCLTAAVCCLRVGGAWLRRTSGALRCRSPRAVKAVVRAPPSVNLYCCFIV